MIATRKRAQIQEEAKARDRRRRVAKGRFHDFVQTINPSLLQYEHVPRLVDTAERVVSGEIDRLLVLMPPRYFKSEVFSRLLPAYVLTKRPASKVGLASYSATLAWKLSANARAYYKQLRGETADDTDAKKEWATRDGGEMWAAGIKGSITGSGFDIGIIDDPMKPIHAGSEAYIDAWETFWTDTWYNRQEPGAAMIVVMQRIGPRDPVDYIYRCLAGDGAEKMPEHWHVLCCDEIKSSEPLAKYDGPMGLPKNCTLIPDPRGEGDLLAPTRFDRDQVERQQSVGRSTVASQRQQRPSKSEGALWEDEWIERHRASEAPPLQRVAVGVDPAGGGKDEVGIVAVGKGRDGHYYVLQDVSTQGKPLQWARSVVGAYQSHRADVVAAESNYGGDMVKSTIHQVSTAVNVKMVPSSRGKELRAEPIAAMYEQGKVHHVGVHAALETQLLTWDPEKSTNSPDRLDALVFALTELAGTPSAFFAAK